NSHDRTELAAAPLQTHTILNPCALRNNDSGHLLVSAYSVPAKRHLSDRVLLTGSSTHGGRADPLPSLAIRSCQRAILAPRSDYNCSLRSADQIHNAVLLKCYL